MTTVIGDEDNGWSSATMVNGKQVQDIHQEAMSRQMNADFYKSVSSKALDNPKRRDSSHKIPLSLCPPSLRIAVARVFKLGGEKPGRYHWNWREEPISYNQYIDAIHRHLARLEDGQDYDEDLSKRAGEPVHHLDVIASNLAMLIDAREEKSLVDDRPKSTGGATKFLDRVTSNK